MRVLVTRPQPQAAATVTAIAARGHEGVEAPVATIERLGFEPVAAEEVDAVLLTSANAAFALLPYRDLPVFAVGEATAAAARQAGATDVRMAGGDWRSLAATVVSAGLPEGSRLLHLSGAEVRGGLDAALDAAHLDYRRLIVYRAVARQWLDPPVLAMLGRGEIDAVMLFSPRHATIWRQLVDRADAAHLLFPLGAVCLSAAVAEPLTGLPWRWLRIASAPRLEAMIDRLDDPG